MLQDFLFGIRTLRRSPGFSILAILCLTRGIGATTSVFSWMKEFCCGPSLWWRHRTAWLPSVV